MTDTHVEIPWGKETLALKLPQGWELLGVMEPSPRAGLADMQVEVERSLASPIGHPRLVEMTRPGMKIALMIDDDSRPTPVRRILPAVLAELARGGIRPEQVTVIPALGVHDPMAEAQVARRVGETVFPALRWETHDCDNPEKLEFLGTSRRGTKVFMNKTVASADLVVSIGCIEPHVIASFGGGYKNLVPGVAGRATIAHNHALNCHPNIFNNVGRPIETNPMRQDLEEAGGMLKPPVFIINAVLNSALEPVQIVSGHPVDAHREGVRTSARIYGAAIPALADVVVTSSHPMDQDLRQGVKALANTVRALRPGGTMITLVRAEEGVGVFGLANRKLPVSRSVLQWLTPAILPLVSRLKLSGMGEEDRFFLYFALQAMRQGELLMVAPTIPKEIQERLLFVKFKEDLEAALSQTARKYTSRAKILIFPHGGSTYPILPSERTG